MFTSVTEDILLNITPWSYFKLNFINRMLKY